MAVSVRSNRRGATLPLSIIVLALMAVAVAIGFARITSERHTTSDAKAQVGAFAVAQSGLSRFLANLNGKPAGDQTATYTDLPGGSAQVELRMLRESTTTLLPAVYIITSRGTYSAAKRYNALIPPAQRTVATYALWKPTPFDLNGAFTSLNGLAINGNSASLSGHDRCGGAMPSIPGVAVPDDQFYPTHTSVVNGNPEDDEYDLGTPGTGGTADQEVDIDWASIKAGTLLPADYTYPTWPTSTQFANWPVTRVNNDGGTTLALPSSGKGILIVTGNLTINGAVPPRTWEGLILVGGNVTANGASNIYGAIVAGLNVKLGQAVPDNDLGNGTKNYLYDSCALTRALGHVGSIQRVRNGWTDTWSSY
jgi:hypothetical protein